MKYLHYMACVLCFCLSLGARSEEAATDGYAYYTFEPDIITNYVNNARKLGYVRITAEAMVEDQTQLSKIRHHEPLILDAIISIIGSQHIDEIRDLEGRERIRKACLDAVNELLIEETGQKLVHDLLFTKYIYQ